MGKLAPHNGTACMIMTSERTWVEHFCGIKISIQPVALYILRVILDVSWIREKNEDARQQNGIRVKGLLNIKQLLYFCQLTERNNTHKKENRQAKINHSISLALGCCNTHRTPAGCNDLQHVRNCSGPCTSRSRCEFGWDGKSARWSQRSLPSRVRCR